MRPKYFGFLALSGLLAGVAGAEYALAHCDGLDGPVVKAAQKALAANNVNLALIWVDTKSEPELKSVFEKAVALRRRGPEARELADRYLFETLVRLHRTGEGAPYTGLKPAGRDLGPAISAADRAIESGDARMLEDFLVKELRRELRESFEQAMAKRKYDPNHVAEGRAYVKSYVAYVHYVERLHEAITTGAAGHYEESTGH